MPQAACRAQYAPALVLQAQADSLEVPMPHLFSLVPRCHAGWPRGSLGVQVGEGVAKGNTQGGTSRNSPVCRHHALMK